LLGQGNCRNAFSNAIALRCGAPSFPRAEADTRPRLSRTKKNRSVSAPVFFSFCCSLFTVCCRH
jgi:hypothetical protein